MVKWDSEEVLFSAKCYASAMLAYYIALRIGLPRPYWAIITAYFVAQPLAGAALAKGLYRLVGTVAGAGATVVLVPTLVNEPIALTAALALWLAVCIYFGVLDRTPRSYAFLLAGFTATIIGFESVNVPGTMFDTAVLRVEEITIGVVVTGLIHGMVFPRTVTRRLCTRLDAILAGAERRSRDALAPDAAAATTSRQIALDLAELDTLAAQLPFDTARIVPRTQIVRAVQDRLLEVLPLAAALQSRLTELTAIGGPPPHIEQLVADIRAWLADTIQHGDRDTSAGSLLCRLQAGFELCGTSDWRDLLTLNLCIRLEELITMHRDARDLNDQLRSATGAASPRISDLLERCYGRALYRDPVQALRAALGAFVCTALCSIFWIATAWPDGAIATLIAGVCCALFGNVDRPAPVIFRYLLGATGGVFASMVFCFVILPRITTFETLAASLAPFLLLLGALIARPALTLPALGATVGFVVSIEFGPSYNQSFEAFANASVALLGGIGFAVVSTHLFQTVDQHASAARLFRAGWREVARQALGRGEDERISASRMLDRIGLLIPRLADAKAMQGGTLLDALTDMRTGLLAGRLRNAAASSTPDEQTAIVALTEGLARHFSALNPARPVAPPEALLATMDEGIAAFVADPVLPRSREALVLLTSLRRNLFPAAAGWQTNPDRRT